jgi:hypothetical protein
VLSLLLIAFVVQTVFGLKVPGLPAPAGAPARKGGFTKRKPARARALRDAPGGDDDEDDAAAVDQLIEAINGASGAQ